MVSSHVARPRRRAGWLAGATASALVGLSAFASSATGAPVTDEHDFPGGDAQGWFSYANAGTVSSSAATGELCAQVDGGTNPWDIALQHDGVTYERDLTYTVAFDRTRPPRLRGSPRRSGRTRPRSVTVVLDGTATPQHVEFTFSPADWPTAPGEPSSPVGADWTTTTGPTSFQLGGCRAYTFCVDNFSMTSKSGTPGPGTPGTVVDHDFADGDLGSFTLYDSAGGGTARAGADGLSACIDLQGGYAKPYEAGLEYPHIDIVEGTNYVLEFTAYASSAANINVLVGQYGDPWHPVLDASAALTSTPTTFTYPFTADASFSSDPTTAFGRIRFRSSAAGRRRTPSASTTCPRSSGGGAPGVRARHRLPGPGQPGRLPARRAQAGDARHRRDRRRSPWQLRNVCRRRGRRRAPPPRAASTRRRARTCTRSTSAASTTPGTATPWSPTARPATRSTSPPTSTSSCGTTR